MKRNQRMVWQKEGVQKVIKMLVDCEKVEEVENLFDRVLTPREINDIARRFQVLTMIDDGRSYADIHMKTGMGPSTIARLSAKCGFGFSKSSRLPSSKSIKEYKGRKTLRYKGVPVTTLKR